MSRKRRGDAPPPPTDAKLHGVERALGNVTRTGVTFTSGTSERFPLPGIVFKDTQVGDDDGDDELVLPLRHREAHKLKARATALQEQDGKTVAWGINGSSLEERNPKWLKFLDEWLTSRRATLGIAPTADVELKLRMLVMAEAGARLDPRGNRDSRGTGVFGCVLVVLPGEFDGGEMLVKQRAPNKDQDEGTEDDDESAGDGSDEEQGEDDDREEPSDDQHELPLACDGEEESDEDENPGEEEYAQISVTWRPSMRGNQYGVSYGAFYDSCEYVSEPVRSGVALCLVYDLVTSTPSEIPLFGGTVHVQQSVASALAEYFDASPAPLVKRLKIGPDAWRAVYDYIVQRQFVYRVNSLHECMSGDNRKIYDSLAAFCDQSGGQYVLYHAHLICSKYYSWDYDDDNDTDEDVSVTLMAPWVKHGESESFHYPPVLLRHRHEVAHSRDLDSASLAYSRRVSSGISKAVLEHFSKLHGSWKTTQFYSTYALVVLPTSMELNLDATYPIEIIIERLTKLLSASRCDALQYARRVIHNRAEWHLRSSDMDDFGAFVQSIISIDDLQLFTRLLCAIRLQNPTHGDPLAHGVKHFGWEACADAMLKSIRSSSTFRGRVNFITAVLYEGLRAHQLNTLLDALLYLHPWTDVKIGQADSVDYDTYTPEVDDFAMLLAVTSHIAPGRVKDVVSIPRIHEIVYVVVPALRQLLPQRQEPSVMRTALQHVWELFQPMLAEIRNEPYTKIRIPDHCNKCRELQMFLTSSATETTIAVADDSEVDHMRLVAIDACKYPAVVKIRKNGSSSIRVWKDRRFMFEGFGFKADTTKKRIQEALSLRDGESHEQQNARGERDESDESDEIDEIDEIDEFDEIDEIDEIDENDANDD